MREIAQSVIYWKILAGVIGMLLPVSVLFIWKRKCGKEISWKPAVVGAITFIVFAQMLEGIPKVLLFGGTTDASEYIWTHPWAYVLIGCLMAGIFEETGRYVAFRWFLKKYRNVKDAVTYGIGHGGIEAILVMGITGFSSIAMIGAVNRGVIAELTTGMSAGQQKSLELQLASLAGYGALQLFLETWERVLAMTLHVALSLVVFQAVKEKKAGFVLLAILLHAVFDIPAALYQCGILSLLVAEILLTLLVVACSYISFRIVSGKR